MACDKCMGTGCPLLSGSHCDDCPMVDELDYPNK